MMFFGFGFLMTFLKKYGYGALTYNFLLSAVTVQWAMLLNQWIKHRIEDSPSPSVIKIGVNE